MSKFKNNNNGVITCGAVTVSMSDGEVVTSVDKVVSGIKKVFHARKAH